MSADPRENDLLWRGIMSQGLLNVDLTGRGGQKEDKKRNDGGKNKVQKMITFFRGVVFQRGTVTYPYAGLFVSFLHLESSAFGLKPILTTSGIGMHG
jgi:hypothetical protein